VGSLVIWFNGRGWRRGWKRKVRRMSRLNDSDTSSEWKAEGGQVNGTPSRDEKVRSRKTSPFEVALIGYAEQSECCGFISSQGSDLTIDLPELLVPIGQFEINFCSPEIGRNHFQREL
jgi:hypothetical protein